MKAKEFIPSTKPRNFVAKNQKTAGAGAHKDKKKALKQGDVKHKQKQFEQGVAEGSSQQFDMGLAKILKQRGYKGPVKLEQLGMKWVEAIGDIVDIDDLIMVQGTDPEYDGWVSYVFGLGKYAYGAEQGYTTGTAKRVEIDTKHEQGVPEGTIIAKDDLVDIYIKGKGKNNTPIQKKVGAQIPNSKVNAFIAKVAEKYGLNPKAFVYGPSGDISERFRDSEDQDEGNTEPGNNFAVYINGKKWKVLPGPYGAYADSPEERIEFQRLKDMAQRKSQQTGKKWEVYVTGEPATK